jgi:hypothetical protein
MDIWHHDPETGLLIGAGTADPDPMIEGGWLIPAFATGTAPPALGEGERARWTGDAWAVEPVPVEPEPEPPPPPTLAELRAARLAELAAKRWAVETAGIVVAGHVVRTDRESQALISGAYQLAAVEPEAVTRFKASSGWVDLSGAEVQAVALAVARHVRQCFAREAELAAAVEAAEDEAELDAIDLTDGWPAPA